MIRVLVVDDHPIFRDGLRTSLEQAPDLELCGEASTATEAIEAAERLGPDVVLMDVDLAGESGIEVTGRVTRAHPDMAVLMLTMHDAEPTVFAALCAGAVGYLLKGSGGTELHRAVRAAAAGEAVFGAGVARRVLSRLQSPEPRQAGPDQDLTVREREILDLMAAGLGNHAIATRLCVAPKTVRNNVSSILSKLRAASRIEAIDRARTWGYGESRSTP
ncbi:MAG: response regulator transcription factor [Marmoricola sp.]